MRLKVEDDEGKKNQKNKNLGVFNRGQQANLVEEVGDDNAGKLRAKEKFLRSDFG